MKLKMSVWRTNFEQDTYGHMSSDRVGNSV